MSLGRASVRTFTYLPVLVSLIVLGGCVQTGRFDFNPFRGQQSGGGVGQEPIEPIEPIRTGPVDSTALPPLDGEGGVMQTPGVVMSHPVNTAPSVPTGPVITTPTWRTMVGSWTAKDANGTCKVRLQSDSTLDFYRASTSGCANKDLSRVSSWEYRGGEVYLYQPGGTVAARLKGGAGNLEGVLTNSGAGLSLTK